MRVSRDWERDSDPEVDTALRELWSAHPDFTLIPHAASFFRKMTVGIGILESLLGQVESNT